MVGWFLVTLVVGFVGGRIGKALKIPAGEMLGAMILVAVCFLSSTPGGLQEMSLLAEDMGVDTPKVAILQTMRLFAVIPIIPQVLRWFSMLFV